MIRLLGKVPKKIIIAFSGGVDSVAALRFLSNGKRDILALHFDHGTDHGKEAREFVESFCKEHKVPLVVGSITRPRDKGESKEAYWRDERYKFFLNWQSNRHTVVVPFEKNDFIGSRIVTCHHLDDVVETYLFSSLHGNAMLIPYSRDCFVRPFLLTEKSHLESYLDRLGQDSGWIEDPSNNDNSYMRNYIRNILIPKSLVVNPGLKKVVKKKILQDFKVLTETNM